MRFVYLGTFKTGGKRTGGNDICVATGIAVRCRRNARCRQRTGKRLSHTHNFGRPSTRRGCRICVTVRLPVRPRRETMYWQANANTPFSVTPPPLLLNVPYLFTSLPWLSRADASFIQSKNRTMRAHSQKTFRYLWRFYSLLFRGFLVAFLF